MKNIFDVSFYRAWVLAISFGLTILVTLFSYYLKHNMQKQPLLSEADKQQIRYLNQAVKAELKTASNFKFYDTTENTQTKLFAFDPNTASVDDFVALGLSEKTAHTILNYRTKGGRFYNKESFKKIWGLKPETYSRLQAYISISTERALKPDKPALMIELNRADTQALNLLPMIGATLSQRIVERRKSLGGFFKKEQLQEVFGLSAETYALIKGQIKVDKSLISHINLNQVLFQELNLHPYFRNGLALAILKYRKQKGKIENWNDLRSNVVMSAADSNNIKPYITF